MHRRSLFFLRAVTTGLFALACPSIHAAGPNAEAEAKIRQIIAQIDQGGAPPRLVNEIFWNGAYLRPAVLPEHAQPTPGRDAIENRVPGSQKDKTEVLRIVVADSGDLAYEYSRGDLQFDLKSGEHVGLQRGILRVWQKDGGEWKVAASFARAYDTVPTPLSELK